MTRFAVALLFLVTVPLGAQTLTGACADGTASTLLDVGDVRAPLYTNGALFWKSSGDPSYEVPAGSGLHAVFSASLWVGGTVGGEPRIAGSLYGPYEFWPGPLAADGTTTAGRCAAFDRLWNVSHQEILTYAASGTASADLASWPIAQGAPFYVDTNGNSRRDAGEPRRTLDDGDTGYSLEAGAGRALDLAAGERPDIVGDQGVWWVMNDAGNTHAWGGDVPLGVEVQVLAIAFGADDRAVQQATAYEITVVNRSTATIDDARVSLYLDPDLGDYMDDYVASDPARGLAIVYNGSEVDNPLHGGYGESPPAVGIDLLNAAGSLHVFEKSGAYPINSPVTSDDRGLIAWQYQRSLWKDGTPLTVGGIGYNPGSTDLTSWSYNGDPVVYGYWTPEQPTPSGPPQDPRDRRLVITSTPVALAPGERRQVDVAVLFAEGGDGRGRLEAVRRLRDISDAVQSAYEAGGLTRARSATVQYGASTVAPGAAVLQSPANGAVIDPQSDGVTFTWAPAARAAVYELHLYAGTGADSVHVVHRVHQPSVTLGIANLPGNLPPPTSWYVVPLNPGGPGPASETQTFTYDVYQPAVLWLGSGTPAFVEIRGPGGIDACGPDATSTGGCPLGNMILGSVNSTADYLAVRIGDGPEASVGRFGPTDFEIRFTEAGSVAYDAASDALFHVPFEVWDIGMTPPDSTNDPADDVQLVAVFDAGTAPACTFDYTDYTDSATYDHENTTPPISAYYAASTYADYASEAAPLVEAASDACPTASGIADKIDVDRGRPLQGFALEQAGGGVAIGELTGTVIRFYTADPYVTRPGSPEPPTPAELALTVRSNPSSRPTATFALADDATVRLRVVDALGREVALLAEGTWTAGTHPVALPAGLASGVYVVVLQAGDRQLTRTATVVR